MPPPAPTAVVAALTHVAGAVRGTETSSAVGTVPGTEKIAATGDVPAKKDAVSGDDLAQLAKARPKRALAPVTAHKIREEFAMGAEGIGEPRVLVFHHECIVFMLGCMSS